MMDCIPENVHFLITDTGQLAHWEQLIRVQNNEIQRISGLIKPPLMNKPDIPTEILRNQNFSKKGV